MFNHSKLKRIDRFSLFNVRKDIEQLIDEKLKMYPNEKRSIINAQIVDDERGNEEIIIISATDLSQYTL
jgi:hypothetical protein